MSIEKRAAPYQGPSDLNKGYSVASRLGGLSYGSPSDSRGGQVPVLQRDREGFPTKRTRYSPSPKGDKYRNEVMKHPQLTSSSIGDDECYY